MNSVNPVVLMTVTNRVLRVVKAQRGTWHSFCQNTNHKGNCIC